MEYIDVEDTLPEQSGKYEVKLHTGSIAPKIIETTSYFTRYPGDNGRRHFWSSTRDWNYVMAWRPIKQIK
jgi:hypothetical protein